MAMLAAWSGACLWIDGPTSRVLAGLITAAWVGAAVAVVALLRPLWRAWAAFAVLFLAVQVWWLSIPPSNDRDWLPDVAEPPRAHFDGDLVTIENVRDFHYRSETDYDEIWETRTYDLSQVVGLDMFLVYWGSPMIAHTITSWEFADGRHLAISIETRKEVGESYSAVLGFFRQYELYYVVADERDLVGLRAAHRGERVFLYRLRTPASRARDLLVDYLETIDRLATEPRWYNALRQNCTTTIRQHARQVAPANPFSWKIIVNGYLDELGYARGTIDTSLPFEELRRRSDVTERAREAVDAPDFSARIREGLPGADRRSAADAAALEVGSPGENATTLRRCGWRAPRRPGRSAAALRAPCRWRGVGDMRDLEARARPVGGRALEFRAGPRTVSRGPTQEST
jgi:hypothetical protein